MGSPRSSTRLPGAALGGARLYGVLALATTTLAVCIESPSAFAADVVPHVAIAGAHAVTAPQSNEFGFGGVVSAGGELVFTRALGLEAKVGFLLLTSGQAPIDATLAPQGTGVATTPTLGLRLHPWLGASGPWLSAGGGATFTGGQARPAFDAALGYDLVPKANGTLAVAPYAGFLHVFQPDTELRPADANVMSLGVRLSFLSPRGDRDKDTIFDDEDACPNEPGIRTTHPKTNGCPDPDRDKDGIENAVDACPDIAGVANADPHKNGCPDDDFDKDGVLNIEDACLHEAGIRTSDPKTNGCPRSDRDKDTVFDDEDACPDVVGMRTDNPKTNGCPRTDRDKDGVIDIEDACPDVAGVPTNSPITNGCPAQDSIRVEGERIILDDVILFDTDSPRVRHASWPICQKVARFILTMTDVTEITVEGHADAVGDDAYNLRLSRSRAESVKKLLQKYGVPDENVKAEAFGRSRLRVQTNHAEKMNRRVEFWITKTRSGHNSSPAVDQAADPAAQPPTPPSTTLAPGSGSAPAGELK